MAVSVNLTRTVTVQLAGAGAVPVELVRTVTVAVELVRTVTEAVSGGDIEQQLIRGLPTAAARMVRLRDRGMLRRLRRLFASPDGAETGQLGLQTVCVGRLEPEQTGRRKVRVVG